MAAARPQHGLARNPLPPASAAFVLAIIAFAWAAERWSLAVYALCCWHWLTYALAFLRRLIPLERFKRDAMLLKAVSIAALAAVFLETVPGPSPVLIMAAGFALNIAAAARLGAERTYYGFELAALPPKCIAAFPYSHLSHPMLLATCWPTQPSSASRACNLRRRRPRTRSAGRPEINHKYHKI